MRRSYHIRTTVDDDSRNDPLRNDFYIRVALEEKPQGGGGGKRRRPHGDDDDENSKAPGGFDLPQIIPLRKIDTQWTHHFKEDGDALSVRDGGEGGYDFYINMDNAHLATELKSNPKIDARLLEAQYQYGMVLLGISLLEHLERKRKEDKQDGPPISETIYEFSRAISPVLLPMIAALGDLEP